MNRLEELLMAWEGQSLDEAGYQELKALLADPKNRAELVKYLHTNEMLYSFFAEQEKASFDNAVLPGSIELIPDASVPSSRSVGGWSARIASSPVRFLAMAASLIVFIGAGVAIYRTLGEPKAVAVEWVHGPVGISIKGKQSEAAAGMKLPSGAYIWGKIAESNAILRYPDGSLVNALGETRLQVELTRLGAGLRLYQGLLTASLNKQDPRRPFIFTTANARAVVVGTQIRLYADKDSTRLEVMEGRVRFTRIADGQSVELIAYQQARVKAGVPFRAEPSDAAFEALDAPGHAMRVWPTLTGYWSFDKNKDDKILDSSGLHHGSLLLIDGKPASDIREYFAPGKKGLALMAGKATLSVKHHAALAPPRFSIALWFKAAEGAPAIEHPVLLNKENASQRSGYSLSGLDLEGETRSNDLRFRLWTDQGLKEVSSSQVPIGEWVHLAVTFDGRALYMYRSGKLAAQAETGPTRLAQNAQNLTVGPFIGLIDELRVYSRTLSPEEIAKLASE